MIEEPESPPPRGQDEAQSLELGDPETPSEGRREEARPNLDERERRISTRRKPMGPPLEKPEEAREEDIGRRNQGPTERPVDPA